MELFDVVCPTCGNDSGDFNETEQDLGFLSDSKVGYSLRAICPECGQKFIHYEVYDLCEAKNIKLG